MCKRRRILVEDTVKPRRPASQKGNTNETGRSSAQTSEHREGQRSGTHSTSGDGRRSPRPQGQAGTLRAPSAGTAKERAPRPQTQAAAPKDADTTAAAAPTVEGAVRPALHVPKKNDDYTRSYRGTSQRAAGSSRTSPNRQVKKGTRGASRSKDPAYKRQPMLNNHRITPFKYDMNTILSETSMDPTMASSFLATVIAKASRISMKDAKDYVKTFLDEGNLTKDEYDKISHLMDRYSKYR